MVLVRNFFLSVPFSSSVTHFPLVFLQPPNPPFSHKHHLLFPHLSLFVMFCFPPAYTVCNPKTTVQDPDNIWARWPVMILTRHHLPAPICQLALVPDTHMYTGVTLKCTTNATEFTQKNKLTVSVAPAMLTSLMCQEVCTPVLISLLR